MITVYRADTGNYQTINLPANYKNMYGQLCMLMEMIEKGAPANPSIDEVYSAFLVAITAEEAIWENKVLRVERPAYGNSFISRMSKPGAFL